MVFTERGGLLVGEGILYIYLLRCLSVKDLLECEWRYKLYSTYVANFLHMLKDENCWVMFHSRWATDPQHTYKNMHAARVWKMVIKRYTKLHTVMYIQHILDIFKNIYRALSTQSKGIHVQGVQIMFSYTWVFLCILYCNVNRSLISHRRITHIIIEYQFCHKRTHKHYAFIDWSRCQFVLFWIQWFWRPNATVWFSPDLLQSQILMIFRRCYTKTILLFWIMNIWNLLSVYCKNICCNVSLELARLKLCKILNFQ